ncbi:MAG: type II restriction endonuclease subunit M [Gammaproteobacteria bacterium]|nr:MAG: type II restriction endonuclease subunit M [Gammaproteobacteria bacterium]
MNTAPGLAYSNRYASAADQKISGETYTPELLANFVARQIAQAVHLESHTGVLRVLDPAVGSGELLVSLLSELKQRFKLKVEVYGFETNPQALTNAVVRLERGFPDVPVHLEQRNFLEFVLECFGDVRNGDLFHSKTVEPFDLIIANPPYVRTQIIGADQAQRLASQFGLVGRVDLYHAFLVGLSQILKPSGVAGIIVSNRFMTTKSGAVVRSTIRERFNLRQVWDLGDTKLFDAAVLPAVLLVEGRNGNAVDPPGFISIYETDETAKSKAADPIDALEHEGVVEVPDGRRYLVRHGKLNVTSTTDAVWRIVTDDSDAWLATVEAHTWGTFRDIGKIRVGVKTCADKVFIRSDWEDLPTDVQPELLCSLTTHHIARRFKAQESKKTRRILYPHEVENGNRRVVDLNRYPHTRAYLEQHRPTLEGRKYVIEAGRKWYELWVPQDPAAWDVPKLVFRDISDEPVFWIDYAGTVVNGDCYWLITEEPDSEDLLWLAVAVGNSTFIEAFYDHRFHNKLYAGRRRFITQYVEQFPLPDPESNIGHRIIAMARAAYDAVGKAGFEKLADELDSLVWEAFGLPVEKIGR